MAGLLLAVFAGKKVFVFLDNDDPGRKHAQQVCPAYRSTLKPFIW